MNTLVFSPAPHHERILALGDHLSMTIRENVEVFHVRGNEVFFVTDKDRVVRGTLSEDRKSLEDIEVAGLAVLEDESSFNAMQDVNVRDIFANIREKSMVKADEALDNILELWSAGMRISRIKQRLAEKSARTRDFEAVIDSPEFSRLQEVRKNVVDWLSENREKLSKVTALRSNLLLSRAISESFNLPKVDAGSLGGGTVSMPTGERSTLYDIVCRQALVRRSLKEAKESFQDIWCTTSAAKTLAGKLYSENSEVEGALVEAISETPYIALATKRQLREAISGNLTLVDGAIDEADVQKFASRLFEMKKPVRDFVVKLISENYGINVYSLRVTPTFGDLCEMQKTIFAAISKAAPRGSIVKEATRSMSHLLGGRIGVDAVDMNDWLVEAFNDAGYGEILSETQLLNYLDFSKVAKDLGSIGQVLTMLQATGAVPGAEGAPQPGGNVPGGVDMSNGGGPGMPDPQMSEDPSELGDGLGMPGDPNDDFSEESDADPMGGDADAAAQGAMGDAELDMEDETAGGMEDPMAGAGMGAEDPMENEFDDEEELESDDVDMDDSNDLLSSLSDTFSQLGDDMMDAIAGILGKDVPEEEGEFGEEGEEGIPGEEGEEGLEFGEEGEEEEGEFGEEDEEEPDLGGDGEGNEIELEGDDENDVELVDDDEDEEEEEQPFPKKKTRK